MNTNQNISTLLPSQLPEYIRNDPAYSNFTLFLQAYYEWMEQTTSVNNTNVLYNSKNLLNYNDIDSTTNDFLKYYVNDFLQYFPKDSLISENLALKTARELYKSKGTPASYKFLFRMLYNSDFDIFYTKDAVLKASAGIWYVPKSVKLSTIDPAFLNIQNLRLFGETSKTIAIVENVILAGNKTEVFISNVERLFNSGETIKVVDSFNQDVYFLNSIKQSPDINGNYPLGSYTLSAKIVGQISQVNIDPNNRGLYYNPGDPVVVFGGLNSEISNTIGATAKIGTTTTGSINQIGVVSGGFGYTAIPNTIISISGAPGAIAIVGSLASQLPPITYISNGGSGYKLNDVIIKGNTSSYVAFADVTSVSSTGAITGITYRTGLDSNTIFGITANVISSGVNASNAVITIASTPGVGIANVTNVVNDTISLKIHEGHVGHQGGFLLGSSNTYQMGNSANTRIPYYFAKMPTANIDTKLSDAFTFDNFATYAISSIMVKNGGGGVSEKPTVSATSTYSTDVYDANNSTNTIIGNLANIGILSPIQIINPGIGYRANDVIKISGGSGYGANAIVSGVSATGGITSVAYVYPNANKIEYPLGGMGYKFGFLPTANVNSSNASASGAVVTIPGILGSGATFAISSDRVGSVTTIDILTYGEDYVSKPSVSLLVSDIVVSNVSLANIPQSGDIVYQGNSVNTSTYLATVDSTLRLTYDTTSEQSKYNIRVFNYNSKPNPSLPLKIQNSSINLIMANTAFANNLFYSGSPTYDSNGMKIYGDGNAKATSKFLNGLTIGSGQYLNTQGQPSSFSVLQSENYNNYTYQITVEKEISKYRDILLKLLHPTGMKFIGRYAVKSSATATVLSQDALLAGHTLSYYTGAQSTTATITTDFTNKSNNIVKFTNLYSANLALILSPNTSIVEMTSTNGDVVKSEVIGINPAANTVTLKHNVWLTFANVASVSANSGSNTISVLSLTGNYNIINNGNYTNPSYPLIDIVKSGDSVLIANNTTKVVSGVDYINNIITLNSNLTGNTSNTMLSVNRSFISSDGNIKIYGPVGQQYLPEITDESGNSLTTENGSIFILG